MSSEDGPFQAEREVMATRAYAALRAVKDANPGTWEAQHLKVMTGAVEACGVGLGAFDLAPFRQLAMYEPFNAVVMAAVIRRVFEAGKAAGPDGAVTEWGVRSVYDGKRLIEEFGNEEEAREAAAQMVELHIPDDGIATLMRHLVGPWEEVAGA